MQIVLGAAAIGARRNTPPESYELVEVLNVSSLAVESGPSASRLNTGSCEEQCWAAFEQQRHTYCAIRHVGGYTSYLLLNRARYRRKHVVGIRAHQSNRTHDDNENHRQHHGILRDILRFVADTDFPKDVSHIPPPV